MIKRFIIAVFTSLLLVLSMALPVLAIADPDTPPSINAAYVYEDLLETGDAGVLIDYFLDYAVPPTETATEAFMGVFIDTDGTTQLKSVAPYAFDDDGYGRGLIWIYFTAAEVTTYSITSASQALYSVWLVGNPTLAWAGDPPKTTAGIDDWQTSGSTTILAYGAHGILYYASILQAAWGYGSTPLSQTTALGSKLTSLGESYFENAIPNLRTMAPSAFAASESDPVLEPLDYSTSFGATMTDGTGLVVGSPITFTAGSTVVNVTQVGTFTFELNQGTVGTMTDLTGTVTGSPLDLIAGTNTATVTVIGTFTIVVNLDDTQSGITDSVTGTGFDLSASAASFGMSTMMFSSLIWLIVTIVICAAIYRLDTGKSGKAVLLVFNISIIGGAVLGLMPILVAVLMFIAFGTFTGYVLFFKGASI